MAQREESIELHAFLVSSLSASYSSWATLRRNRSAPWRATSETDTGMPSRTPRGMLNCIQSKAQIPINQRQLTFIWIAWSVAIEAQQIYTWQNPDSPAIDKRENALARKFSSAAASVRSFGGEPETVGIARIPSSYRWKRDHPEHSHVNNLWLSALLFDLNAADAEEFSELWSTLTRAASADLNSVLKA